MPTRTLRNGLLAALAAVGMLTGTAQAASAQSGSGTASAAPQSASRVYMTTVVSQWTHWTPDWHDSSHAGTLYAGSNYFLCYTYGLTYSDLGRQSSVWLKTDDDFGNHNVYVSDVYLNDEGFRNDILWLPKC
ncbi:hypothetical protein [Streptomyces sp. NPDC090080]|jgi:hypothetical protein|uniref:hypothetical protein n=1 Tax=Streptomyces sp. NPDC090080 TaxID=3365939 RepID=UPI00380BBC71